MMINTSLSPGVGRNDDWLLSDIKEGNIETLGQSYHQPPQLHNRVLPLSPASIRLQPWMMCA